MISLSMHLHPRLSLLGRIASVHKTKHFLGSLFIRNQKGRKLSRLTKGKQALNWDLLYCIYLFSFRFLLIRIIVFQDILFLPLEFSPYGTNCILVWVACSPDRRKHTMTHIVQKSHDQYSIIEAEETEWGKRHSYPHAKGVSQQIK